jgi:hypothetical protein
VSSLCMGHNHPWAQSRCGVGTVFAIKSAHKKGQGRKNAHRQCHTSTSHNRSTAPVRSVVVVKFALVCDRLSWALYKEIAKLGVVYSIDLRG